MHQPPPHPLNEDERLAVLRKYRILDTEPEPQFDRIVEIAKRQFNVPIALVAFMDEDRNFLKARGELPIDHSPRDVSFCGHTILQQEVMVVKDASKDDRFAENPLVTGDFALRFYAGAPLIREGQQIGTVCLFDTSPREFTASDRRMLEDLASVASDHLEMRLAVGNVLDEIETRRAAEESARHLALHDALTGLPNRNSLNAFLKEEEVPGTALRYAFYADLDDFKYVNEVLGHAGADLVLRQTADAIREAAGPDSFIARISGDEFVGVITGRSRLEVEAIAAAIIDRVGAPHPVGSRMFSWGLSMGLAAASAAEIDLGALLRRADMALFAAKEGGGKRFSWFDKDMATRAARRRRLAADLGEAISAGTIEVHYQTIHDASSRAVVGVEALARWSHPELGDIGPLEFVAIAEENGQIVDLGRHVTEVAIRDAAAWPDIFVAVNLSPVEFQIPGFADGIIEILSKQKFPPNRLQFEITESVLLRDIDLARQQVAELQGHGVRVALDDFGTGYASLSYLTTIPFDKLKIDRSFVMGLIKSPIHVAIVQSIIELARQLDMRVTAEGIETEYEEVMLRAAGCSSFQGYRFSRPVPAAEIDRLFAAPAIRVAG